MNLTRLVVLGLLAERGPRHGHQLRRAAELAEADRWAGIAVRSLHRELRGLESEGLVEAVRTERAGRLPERTVYGLTGERRREVSVRRELRGLESEGLVEGVGTMRVVRRPERTVYGFTGEGRRELSVLRQQA